MGRFEDVCKNPDPTAFHHEQHSDLLLLLCEAALAKDIRNFSCRKIKSHVDVATIQDPIAAYHAMGNRFADELAKKATDRFNAPLHQLTWEVANWYSLHIELVGAIQNFLALAEARRLDGLQEQTPNIDNISDRSFTLEHPLRGNHNTFVCIFPFSHPRNYWQHFNRLQEHWYNSLSGVNCCSGRCMMIRRVESVGTSLWSTLCWLPVVNFQS